MCSSAWKSCKRSSSRDRRSSLPSCGPGSTTTTPLGGARLEGHVSRESSSLPRMRLLASSSSVRHITKRGTLYTILVQTPGAMMPARGCFLPTADQVCDSRLCGGPGWQGPSWNEFQMVLGIKILLSYLGPSIVLCNEMSYEVASRYSTYISLCWICPSCLAIDQAFR